AIRDAQFKPLSRRFGARWVWIGGAAVAAGAIASAAYLAGSRHAASETPAAPTIAAAPAGGAVPVMVAPDPAPVSAPASVAIAAPDPWGVRVASGGAEPPLSLAERLAATEAWLQRTPDSHYFIQLLVTDAGSQREVLDFMANNARVLDARQVRVYRSRLSGRDRLGVIYGDYPSRAAAWEASGASNTRSWSV
ncbi:MAG TPA: ATPase, partial [Accumulibacter sp.]|nr:ATPase [Accumulibacter sp.]